MITCLEINTRAIGNALFEYATLFGVGNKLDLPIRVPVGKNHVHEPTGQDIVQLKDVFDLTAQDILQKEIDSIKGTYVEKRKEYNPEIWKEVKDDTNLIGFFQSEEYFNHCKDVLKKELKFKDKWIKLAINKFNDLNADFNRCISLHIRRGDYSKPELQPFHPLLPIQYYATAYKALINDNIRHSYDKILVFTDDKEYCKELFKKNDYAIIVDNTDYKEFSAVIDLCMMSMCGYHILANSSFSYWGAWLSNSKKVIYPKIWMGPAYNWYCPISNKEWIKI